MTWQCYVLILAILLLFAVKGLVIVLLFMASANLEHFVCYKILCLVIVGMYEIHIKEINIKNQVYNYFSDLIKAKKLEIKNILIDEKN